MSDRIPLLQIMHGYNPPFLQLARRYALAFDPERFEVRTLFLTGEPDEEVRQEMPPGQVIFGAFRHRELAGMKLRLLWRLWRLHRDFPFRLIVAHRYKAIFAALLTTLLWPDLRVIGVAHAFGVMHNAGRRRLVRWFRNRIHLLGVSRAVSEDLRRDCGFLEPERIAPLLNAVDIDALVAGQLRRDAARGALDLTDDDFVFANVGRYHPDKDQPLLVRAFADASPEMPNARLLLIGEGKLRGILESLVRELGMPDRIRIAGAIPEASRYFRAFDAYVSSSDHEPFGIVLTEAMAAKLPILAADSGGAPEVVGEQGVVFPNGDQAALAEQLKAVYRLPAEQRRRMGQLLFERLQREFSPTAFQARLRRLRALDAYWPQRSHQ